MYKALYKDKLITVDELDSNIKTGLSCPLCKSIVIPKRGEINVHHFSHKKLKDCDTWHDSQDYKMEWFSEFPEKYIECNCVTDNERHRADVNIENKLIFQFYNRPLSITDWSNRINFYKKFTDNLIVIVDCREKEIYPEGVEEFSPFITRYRWKHYSKSIKSPKGVEGYTLFLQLKYDRFLLVADWNSADKDWSRFTVKAVLNKSEVINYGRFIYSGKDITPILRSSKNIRYYINKYLVNTLSRYKTEEYYFHKNFNDYKEIHDKFPYGIDEVSYMNKIKDIVKSKCWDFHKKELDRVEDSDGNISVEDFKKVSTSLDRYKRRLESDYRDIYRNSLKMLSIYEKYIKSYIENYDHYKTLIYLDFMLENKDIQGIVKTLYPN